MSTTTTTTTTTADPMAWATPGGIALVIIAVIVAVLLLRYITKRRGEASTAAQRPVAPPSHPTIPAPQRVPPPPATPEVEQTPLAPTATLGVPVPPQHAERAPIDAAPVTTPAAAPDPLPVPVAPAAAGGTDDLTRLKGVGPKLAIQLAALGYASFAQIAALSPADADALDAQLGSFKGRLTRDRWIEQATYLAKGDVAGFEAAFGKL